MFSLYHLKLGVQNPHEGSIIVSLKRTHAKWKATHLQSYALCHITQFTEILTKAISKRVEEHTSELPAGKNHTGRVLV